MGHGKSWKMVLIVQNELGRLFFVKIILENFQDKLSNFSHGKLF